MKYFKPLMFLIVIWLFTILSCSNDDTTVYVLYEEYLEAGTHLAEMELLDGDGDPLPSGYYRLTMEASGFTENATFTIDTQSWEQDPKEVGLQALYPLGGYMKLPFSIPTASLVKFTARRAHKVGI